MSGSLRSYTQQVRPSMRLVCFPPAGGSASFYRSWRDLVPPDVELLAVQYPGRQDRFDEPPADTMDDLVRDVLPDLAALVGQPVIFLGHSMGASVAYEAIRRMPVKPVLLVASARPGPGAGRPGDLHLRSDTELLAGMDRFGGISSEALSHPELRELLVPIMRADCRVIETYRPVPGARINVPVYGVVGNGDPEVSVADIQFWRHVTTANFSFQVLDGDHFYITQHAQSVIRAALSRAGW